MQDMPCNYRRVNYTLENMLNIATFTLQGPRNLNQRKQWP